MDVPVPDKVMDLLIDTVCVVDEDGYYVYLSASCEQLFGYRPEELIGRNMIELVHPEDRSRTLSAVDEIIAGNSKMHFENRYVRKDGQIVHIMWSARWLGSERLRVAVARDVTKIRRSTYLNNAIFEISEAAHTSAGPENLYRKINALIRDLITLKSFYIALLESESDGRMSSYCIDKSGNIRISPAIELLDDNSLIAEVVREGRPLIVSAQASSGYTSLKIEEGEWLGVPLMTQKGVIGAIALQSAPEQLSHIKDDQELLQFISMQIAAVIERKQTEAELHYMALHDQLTGLPNRNLLYDRFDMALNRAKRESENLAVFFIDVDGFKIINDEFGHENGDRLLCDVAQRLRRCVRAQDTVGRFGGDEFTVLLTNIKNAGCVKPLEHKIISALSKPFLLGGKRITMTISIGCAIYPEDGKTREMILNRADSRMYKHKRGECDRIR